MSAVFRSIDYTQITSPTGTPHAYAYNDNIFTDAEIKAQFAVYGAMWEMAKVKKMVIEMWVNDNDDLTTPNLQYPRLMWWHDSVAGTRTMTEQSLNGQPGRKEVFLKPMQKYRISMSPKFDMALYEGNNKGTLTFKYGLNKNPYRDVSDFSSASSFYSENSIQTTLYGAAVNEIRYRFYIYMDFTKKSISRSYQ